jgi:hypothetical protein
MGNHGGLPAEDASLLRFVWRPGGRIRGSLRSIGSDADAASGPPVVFDPGAGPIRVQVVVPAREPATAHHIEHALEKLQYNVHRWKEYRHWKGLDALRGYVWIEPGRRLALCTSSFDPGTKTRNPKHVSEYPLGGFLRDVRAPKYVGPLKDLFCLLGPAVHPVASRLQPSLSLSLDLSGRPIDLSDHHERELLAHFASDSPVTRLRLGLAGCVFRTEGDADFLLTEVLGAMPLLRELWLDVRDNDRPWNQTAWSRRLSVVTASGRNPGAGDPVAWKFAPMPTDEDGWADDEVRAAAPGDERRSADEIDGGTAQATRDEVMAGNPEHPGFPGRGATTLYVDRLDLDAPRRRQPARATGDQTDPPPATKRRRRDVPGVALRRLLVSRGAWASVRRLVPRVPSTTTGARDPVRNLASVERGAAQGGCSARGQRIEQRVDGAAHGSADGPGGTARHRLLPLSHRV